MDRLTLKERAAGIARIASALADELSQTGYPEPSFEHGLPPPLQGNGPESAASSLRGHLVEMIGKLYTLLREPASYMSLDQQNPTVSIHPLVRLGIAEHFPDKGASVVMLARTFGLTEHVVRRLLAHSATHHVNYEAERDFFVHTAASRALAQSESLRDWLLLSFEEIFPASFKVRMPSVNDMYMMAFQNARERTVDDFAALIKAADSRYELTATHQPSNSVVAVMEVTFNRHDPPHGSNPHDPHMHYFPCLS
ncbi:hypothetical protein BDV06DRAFT_229194 [Aspergillus oleicola]